MYVHEQSRTASNLLELVPLFIMAVVDIWLS